MSEIDTTTETAPVKIKVQRRTPSERQMEALEKARKQKAKNKITSEIKKETSFLAPSPFLLATIGLGSLGLVAFYFLKQETKYENTQPASAGIPAPVPAPVQENPVQENPVQQSQPIPVQPPKISPKTEAFFNGSAVL